MTTGNNLDAVVEANCGERQSYSVWGIPPVDVSHRIKKLMEGLRAEFGGPEIEPHIPLVGSIRMTNEDVLKRFRSSPTHHYRMEAYVVKVEAVTNMRSYYQCVSLFFHRTREVDNAIGTARALFGLSNPAFPHLSLLYGNLTEEERKKAQEKVCSLDEGITSLSFPITRVALCKTDYKDKTFKSWEKIAELPLQFY